MAVVIRVLWLILAVSSGVLAIFVPPASSQDRQPPRLETFRGKIISVNDRLKKLGVALDPDAGLHLALETDKGEVLPLLRDSGSLMFFRDNRLLDRPIEARARLLPGTGLLQIISFHALKDGQRFEVFYWCETCAIKRLYLEKTGVCECCGGVMELRESPVP
ncbi:MAG: hypothetical protein NZM31_09910 [Gemmatales bacterium]|nr:hypothetical protein [Gemmatales bacterium]MDW8387309.1 hypothetical protein [Gemmatales bacterium]